MLAEDDTYLRLVDGTELVEALGGFDAGLLSERGIELDSFGDSAWVLEPGALRRLDLSPGDLVGITVRPEGFELSKVSPGAPAPDLEVRLAKALELLGQGGPDQIDSVVWLACANDPNLFASPLQPLAEIFDHSGLVTDGDQIGPPGFDFASWRLSKRVEHIADVHQLDDDSALAVLA